MIDKHGPHAYSGAPVYCYVRLENEGANVADETNEKTLGGPGRLSRNQAVPQVIALQLSHH